MDILAVIAAITNLITEVVKSQPPDVAAELWKLHLKDVQEFRKFFENVLPHAERESLPRFTGPPDPQLGQTVAKAWEDVVGKRGMDAYSTPILLRHLKKAKRTRKGKKR